MTHATSTRTTKSRRAPPAAVHAALRSCETSAYPRRRASRLNKHWIPACAGMTVNALGQKSSLSYPDGATYSYSYDSKCGRVAAQQRGTHRPTPCGCNQLSTVNLPTGFGSITLNSYQWGVPGNGDTKGW